MEFYQNQAELCQPGNLYKKNIRFSPASLLAGEKRPRA